MSNRARAIPADARHCFGRSSGSWPRTAPGQLFSTRAQAPVGSPMSRAGWRWRTACSTVGAWKTSGSTNSPRTVLSCRRGCQLRPRRAPCRCGRKVLATYLVRRFGLMLLTLFGISVVIFLMLRVAPGNIADVLFDAAVFVDPDQKASLERDLGLDQPLIVQYANWIDALARGDLGHSYVT